MSHRVRSSRKIVVGDRGRNIEIIAALPMYFVNRTVADCCGGKRRQIAERGIPVMLGPGFRVEIACNGRKCHQVIGTGAHPEDNGATAGVTNELDSFCAKLTGYLVCSGAHAIDNNPAVSVECPPSLFAFPVRRGTKITGPSQVNGRVGGGMHQAQ